MKMTITAAELLKKLEEVSKNYNCYGLRTSYDEVNVGDRLGNSWQTFDGEEPYELPGTCCTGFGYLWFDGDEMDIKTVEKSMRIHEAYPGDKVYIIAGNGADYGNDEDELIIEDAVVVDIIG